MNDKYKDLINYLIERLEEIEEEAKEEISTLAFENRAMAEFIENEGFDVESIVFDGSKKQNTKILGDKKQ